MNELISQDDRKTTIFVSGHRNPDIDSIAGAVALAELRRRQTGANIEALCPGVLPDRAAWLFKRFNMTPPPSRNDVYIRIADIMENVPLIRSGSTLFDAVAHLRESSLPRLPVVNRDGDFLGMLSGMALLTHLLNIGSDEGSGLTGRKVCTSIELIRQVLEAEILNGKDIFATQDFEVYVAAMSQEGFEEHLPDNFDKLAVIVGDRPDIHLRALARKLRLLIVTGDRPVDPLILQGAKASGVSIIKTALDSATVIRRLKFSVPVEFSEIPVSGLILNSSDRLIDVRSRIQRSPMDVIPVVDNGKLTGAVLKNTLNTAPPFSMILVDHNELDQSIPGADELPVVEVVDHHRIGMNPTAVPIKFTGDIVGSSCTLIALMYRGSGESLTPGMAGLLLGGIVSDTLHLKSPTTSAADRRMAEWLEKISGVSGEDLMTELLKIDSALAVKPVQEVLDGDRKDYSDGNYRFALSQVEESNLELLSQRSNELTDEIKRRLETEHLDFFGLLVTDAVRENSELLVVGRDEIVKNLPYAKLAPGRYALPGVLSRKKQLLPQILAITSSLKNMI